MTQLLGMLPGMAQSGMLDQGQDKATQLRMKSFMTMMDSMTEKVSFFSFLSLVVSKEKKRNPFSDPFFFFSLFPTTPPTSGARLHQPQDPPRALPHLARRPGVRLPPRRRRRARRRVLPHARDDRRQQGPRGVDEGDEQERGEPRGAQPAADGADAAARELRGGDRLERE